jgi:hypothetical protein
MMVVVDGKTMCIKYLFCRPCDSCFVKTRISETYLWGVTCESNRNVKLAVSLAYSNISCQFLARHVDLDLMWQSALCQLCCV